MSRKDPRDTRISIYFDDAIWSDLERIAGPFGEASRVVFVALRDGRTMAAHGATGTLTRQAQVQLPPATRARLNDMAAQHGVTWQTIARYVIVQWVADYDLGKVPNRRAG